MGDDLISRKAAIEALGERPTVWNERTDEYDLGQRNQYDIDKLAIETVPSAQIAQQWIPVRERLPDNVEFPANYDGVLVSIEGNVYMAYRYGDCWCIAGSGVVFNSYLDGVDAWMPVPKQYEEVK